MNVKEIQNLNRIEAFDGQFAIITTTEEKCGIINRQGEVVLEPLKCDLLYHNFGSVYVVFYDNQHQQMFDAEKNSYLPLQIAYLGAEGQYVYTVNREEVLPLHGVCDAQFQTIIEPTEWIVYRRGLYWTKNAEGLWGAINPQGQVVLPFQYQDIVVGSNHERDDQVCAQDKDGLYYLIDNDGQHLSKGYEYLRPFNEAGYAIATQDGELAIVDSQENIVATHKDIEVGKNPFLQTYWCSPTRIAYKKNGKYGLMTADGKIITEPIYESISAANRTNFIQVTTMECKKKYINADGETVLKEYDYAGYRSKYNVFTVRNNGKRGICDGNGNVIIPCEYDYLSFGNSDGLSLISVKKDGRCYFINEKQEEVKLF